MHNKNNPKPSYKEMSKTQLSFDVEQCRPKIFRDRLYYKATDFERTLTEKLIFCLEK